MKVGYFPTPPTRQANTLDFLKGGRVVKIKISKHTKIGVPRKEKVPPSRARPQKTPRSSTSEEDSNCESDSSSTQQSQQFQLFIYTPQHHIYLASHSLLPQIIILISWICISNVVHCYSLTIPISHPNSNTATATTTTMAIHDINCHPHSDPQNRLQRHRPCKYCK